jgi:hypothetical protein
MRHRTLLVGPILIDGLPLTATPEPFGPRNCGQLADEAEVSEMPEPKESTTNAAMDGNRDRDRIILYLANVGKMASDRYHRQQQ